MQVSIGPIESLRCLASYAKEWVLPTREDGSFEKAVCRRFGRRLFEVFFKSYSEKLWGVPCNKLDADFAAQRIKQFSLSAAIGGALFPKRRKQHRTLVDEFAYPAGGTGMVYERMAEAIRQRGGQVHLQTPVKRVLINGGRAVGVELASGETLACDQVISTMPLTVLVRQLENVPTPVVEACDQLQFRSTIIVYLEILNENPFPDNWIYVHHPDLRFGRVTNFRNWTPELYGDSPNAILAMEYWCNADDEFWRQDEPALVTQAREEIVKSGLVKDPKKIGRSFVVRIARSYPGYRCGYQKPLRVIKDYLGTISGLQVIGRYGAFKYNNQDHSILMGILAAENILRSGRNDLWAVNADYDKYQEACAITETGLVEAK